MSYLDAPRMNFFGYFQADVSTINNTTSYYDIATFKPEYQQLDQPHATLGGWNPEGTGSFRLIDCRISGARLGRQQLSTPADDPVIGMLLENASQRVSGKLVDLDPEQQMVSQIWGMQLRLGDGGAHTVFSSDYEVAAFINLWKRQQTKVQGDQQLAAVYHSVLRQVDWRGESDSAVLRSLRAASEDGLLSINMNVYGYGRDPDSARYTLGHVVGSIGPYHSGTPRHFVVGRQMMCALSPATAVSAPQGVYDFTCLVDEASQTLRADFGNSLPIHSAEGGFEDVGQLLLALDKNNPRGVLSAVDAESVQILGEIDYRRDQPAQQQAWYHSTGGIVDLDYSAAGVWAIEHIGERQLLLLTPLAGPAGAHLSYQVVVQESMDGLYVRSDDFVCRLNPDETAQVDFYVSRFGKPHAAELELYRTAGMMGPTANDDPSVNIGPLDFPERLSTDARGKAVLAIHAPAQGAGNRRGYIDGQLYGIGYGLVGQSVCAQQNPWNFISVLAFDRIDMPVHPTWYEDIKPIFKQYANLYPIMSRHLIELGKYDAVLPHVRILDMAFSLPRSDPNHMPVTRDLSDAKRDMILKWLREPGADGKPLKGVAPPPKPVPAEAPTAASTATEVPEPMLAAGKLSYLIKRIAVQGRRP
jgi:hypothetical protein